MRYLQKYELLSLIDNINSRDASASKTLDTLTLMRGKFRSVPIKCKY